MTPTVEHFHRAVREVVAERFAASGRAWEDFVHDPACEITAEDLQAVEKSLLDTGYTFETSAHVSLAESPEKYKPLAVVSDSGNQVTDDEGRKVVGTGDNVFSAPDLTGTARFVGTVDVVMEMLLGGVPPDTIAIIDDSGGTLTAPILEGFAGVICMGGTVRSHLGILTREYNIPCLMAAELDGLADGDKIHVQYSKPATDAYAERDESARVRISKIS
ncbi:PEP-utilizing enzyme [Aeromicrobium wangtongii]|uniref:PEP-utilizing enzyme n=1 Tax=Aeromicrobium wangtongii TaxID=2969247 RepID=UPI0020174EC6|nr:PEP-utilizing enzyme [Aeromicrobium wangtongii]MCL3818619.1 PEP-utilizing enzyme [Aeromicrobium wangtongii]